FEGRCRWANPVFWPSCSSRDQPLSRRVQVLSNSYAIMCIYLHTYARLRASLVPHDSNEKARKLNGLRACPVEMPGIEPGSDVAFVRLLRAQSAWSFIDLRHSQTSTC